MGRFTRRMDITDGRNGGLMGATLLGGGIVTAGKSLLVGTGVNRVARLADKAMNTRSRVKRYVESVEAYGPGGTKAATGVRSKDVLAKMKANQADQKAYERKIADFAKKSKLSSYQAEEVLNSGLDPQDWLNEQWANSKSASMDRKEETSRMAKEANFASKAAQSNATFNPSGKNILAMDEASKRKTHIDNIQTGMWDMRMPDESQFEPYQAWQDQTGMTIANTFRTLEILENKFPGQYTGQADRYLHNPRSFMEGSKPGPDAYLLQVAVRNEGNPGFKPQKKSKGKQGQQDGMIPANSNKPVGNRGKFKAREGERRKTNVVTSIEASKGRLNGDHYMALLKLAEEMDSPAVIADARGEMMKAKLAELFPNPVERDWWTKEFGPLAAIGNDIVFKKEGRGDQPSEVTAEAEIEKAFEEKVAKVKAAAPAKKTAKKKSLEEFLRSAWGLDTTLDQSQSTDVDTDIAPEATESTAEAVVEATTVKAPKTAGKNSTENMVNDRILRIENAVTVAKEKGHALLKYVSQLGLNNRDRVEALIYDVASDRVTQNQLVDRYAEEHFPGNPQGPQIAAGIVNDALATMERDGQIKRILPTGATSLKVKGKYKKDSNNQQLMVIQLEVLDPEMADNLNTAKGVNYAKKIVSQQGPTKLYAPNDIRDGENKAFKDYDADYINASFEPILNMLNGLRQQKLTVDNRILTQIEDAVVTRSDNTVGTVKKVLAPAPGEDGQMLAFAKLIHMLGPKETRTDTRVMQEYSSQANGRITAKNGAASTQGADLMKGLTRMDGRTKVGSPEGLNMLFHSFGNILGFDKDAPSVRRAAIMQPGVIKLLQKFAGNPFGKTMLNNVIKGMPATEVGKLVKSAEGFFQVLNVAHEVNDLVLWSEARHPDKSKLTPEMLLQHPEVQKDIAANYETDYIVQLDASNNAYQLLGLTTGDTSLLEATSLSPREGVDPDTTKGGDIYMAPSLAVVARIPALANLGLSDKQVRKVFKGAIGTFLYEAELNSRRESFAEQLGAIADGAKIAAVVEGKGLMTIPAATVSDMMSPEGVSIVVTKYNKSGEVKSETVVRKRVVQADGKFALEVAGIKGKFKTKRVHNTANEAIEASYEGDLYSLMSRELLRDINQRHPIVQDYLGFARTLTEMVKERGMDHVKVTSPDGIQMQTRFKDDVQYLNSPTQLGDNVVPLGVRGTESKLTGRGVAAFMMHQLDAYVLREVYKRMKTQGMLQTGFNPIHDSFGFSPAEAPAGQAIWAEVMQEIGSGDTNIFVQVLMENGINLAEFRERGGVIPNRQAVTPQPVQNIPTALS
jgi:hypothetical protein